MKLKSESTVISQAVNEWFTSYLPIAKGCSNHTQRSYFTALSQYMQFLQEEKKSHAQYPFGRILFRKQS